MIFDDQQIIEAGSKLSMYRVDPVAPKGSAAQGRVYECKVLSVLGKDTFKLSLPMIYEEPWMPPLDGIYSFSVITDEIGYCGKGRLLERFRDRDGDCCILKLTESLSLADRKDFLSIRVDMEADVEVKGGKDPIVGKVTSLSVDFMILECSVYIEDGSELKLHVYMENGKEFSAEATVSETVRLRGGNYQSRLMISRMDIKYQRELAVWILQHYISR